MIQPPSAQSPTDSILWALPFCQMEWELTPPAVQDYIKHQHQQIAQFQAQIAQLQQQVETLQGRVEQTSQTSEFIPLSFWYDAPLISRYSDRRHDPWLVYGLPSCSLAR